MNNRTKNVYLHNPRAEMQQFLARSAARILDVGCNTGAFGEALKTTREVEVWGVEPMADAAERAQDVLDKVINARFDADAPIPDAYFDAVVFNDVLEHLVDPWGALELARTKLRPGGQVIASLPNLLHQSNLLHLLADRNFEYEERGIRDRTHLRFFTRKSAVHMFEEAGYEVVTTKGINESWWTPSLTRRTFFMLFDRWLNETKYVQNAFVACPSLKTAASCGALPA